LTRGIAINDEVLARIRRSKHWCKGQPALENLKTFLTFFCPLKLNAFVKQISQGLGNLGKVLDKTTTIAGESKKTSDLLNILRRSPVQNSLNSF
jgi:hypothetical protein